MELVLAPFAVIDRWIATGEVLKIGGQIRHGKQIFDIANRSIELEGYIRHIGHSLGRPVAQGFGKCGAIT
jgi:hypothetical protein